MSRADTRAKLDESIERLSADAQSAALAEFMALAARLCPKCGRRAHIRTSRLVGETRVIDLRCGHCGESWKNTSKEPARYGE